MGSLSEGRRCEVAMVRRVGSLMGTAQRSPAQCSTAQHGSPLASWPAATVGTIGKAQHSTGRTTSVLAHCDSWYDSSISGLPPPAIRYRFCGRATWEGGQVRRQRKTGGQ